MTLVWSPGFTQWDPALISTALWLDAADTSTVTTVSGAVSQWNDKSGNGRHAAQSNAALRPSFSSNSIAFNGTSHLICQPGWGNYWEWLLVLKFDQTNVVQVPIRDSASGNSTAVHGYTSSGVDFYRLRNSSNTAYSTSIANEFGTQMRIQGFSSRTSNNAFAFVDGSQKTSWAVTGNMGTDLYLGVNGTSLGNGLQGTIREFVLLPAQADDVTRQKLEGYLAHKWGLTANLPADHPYKVNPPAP